MEANTVNRITMLPIERIVFVKKINIENTFSSDVLCYVRKPSEQYSMKPEDKSTLERAIFGYKEQEYPCDELDEAIIDFLQSKYPNAKCQTTLLMFDSEIAHNVHWLKQYQKHILQIIIEYIPEHLPPIGADSHLGTIEVYSMPDPLRKRNHLDSPIIITTSYHDEYSHLCSLLDNSYTVFSEALKD